MGISKSEAASALTDIESTAGRSRLLKGYHVAGPILMVWGVIWALGYSGMGLLPSEQWGLIWLVLDVAGVVATILLSRGGKGAAKAGQGWKIVAGVLAILAFYAATLTLFQPISIDATIAYPGVVTGLVYAGIGIAFAPRYLWIGGAVFAASLVGYFFFQPWLTFWMAAVGGGGLFVAGLWLRRA
ncbi:hypothetical protein ASD21_11545 [Caulobacter sp. Root1455]|uniref:hypothetical protein n=1 Tax=unclassified Caulobacter TaxID=2648921 RepID=UPI000700CB1E|nr:MULTISPECIES: hypothetical protein [unclassified Caulobacter]KQY35410.1 hypothetical protein ASD38_02275 [Caulobacter sp. Root487D2Y]KQY93388.1 hypothetical protein ASD21_11545 [Caulobacter sp. Root1455]